MNYDAEKYLVNICNNSIHLLINYIEKILIYNDIININIIQNICCNINYNIFQKYTFKWLKERNIDKATKLLQDFVIQGYSIIDILENYYYYIKNISLLDDKIKFNIITYIMKYINIFYNNSENQFELILFTNDLIKNIN